MRRTQPKIVNVGTSPVTVTFDDFVVGTIVIQSIAHLAPIYFRCDGTEAVTHGESGVYVCTGYNGGAILDIPYTPNASVSLVSTATGEVLIVAIEGV